jgi:hypothetical protein
VDCRAIFCRQLYPMSMLLGEMYWKTARDALAPITPHQEPSQGTPTSRSIFWMANVLSVRSKPLTLPPLCHRTKYQFHRPSSHSLALTCAARAGSRRTLSLSRTHDAAARSPGPTRQPGNWMGAATSVSSPLPRAVAFYLRTTAHLRFPSHRTSQLRDGRQCGPRRAAIRSANCVAPEP